MLLVLIFVFAVCFGKYVDVAIVVSSADTTVDCFYEDIDDISVVSTVLFAVYLMKGEVLLMLMLLSM